MTVPDPDELSSLLTLGLIVELSSESAGQPVNHREVLDGSPAGLDAPALSAHVHALAESGYVVLDERASGAWLVRPRASGLNAWRDLDGRRKTPRERRRRMRDDYLIWLYDQHEEGKSPSADSYLETGANFLGLLYTQEDLELTGEWLKERNFIRGPGVWGRPDPLRPQLTAKGTMYVEEGLSVHETPASAGSTSYHNVIHGSAIVAQNSQNVTQTQNINTWKDQARELADAVAQLAQLTPSDGDLSKVAVDLREEIDGDADPGHVRVFVDNLVKALGTGVGGALGGALMAQAAAVLSVLPQ